MPRDAAEQQHDHDTVQNVNSLTLAFAKAVGNTQGDKNDNLVVSPYNALTALSMLAKGAEGNTREELAQTLFGLSGTELDQAVESLTELNQIILDANKDQVTLATANGVWANNQQLHLNPVFVEQLKKLFGAEISEEEFSGKTVDKINAWAAKNTNNLITKVLDRLDPDAYAVLASALYFKGKWTNKFDKEKTENRTFTTDDGASFDTPTMNKTFKEGEVRYQKRGDYEAVALTYGESDREAGKKPSMRIVLVRPTDESVSARDWLAKQDGNSDWLQSSAFGSTPGTVELPRMDIKQHFDLIPALKEMGIKEVFDARANLSQMTHEGEPLFVGSVSHDTVFKTDEEGSEAAAVTTIGVFRATAVVPKTFPFHVKFDRSFVFALQDITTGAVLFVGAVNKPNNDMKPGKPAPKKKKSGWDGMCVMPPDWRKK